MEAADAPTGATLFNLIDHCDDPRAWKRFVLRYGPLIEGWCRAWRLQEADVLDAVQDVLVRLFRYIGAFQWQRDGSFRAYLKTITQNVLRNQDAARRRLGQGAGGSGGQQLLNDVAATDDLAQQLDREFDREILEEAMTRVRQRVEPHTWEAFRLTAIEALSGKEAAVRLGMQCATVFVAKSKVIQMLKETISRLEKSDKAEGNDP